MKTAFPLDAPSVTAAAMLAAGVVFALLGLLLPPAGAIHESVLWVFAQCLIYAGSALGIASYLAERPARRTLAAPPAPPAFGTAPSSASVAAPTAPHARRS